MLEGASKATLMSIETLLVGFDHIDGVVEHDRAETSKATRQQVNQDLPADVLLKELLRVLEDDEADTLVSRLLEYSGEDTSVYTRETMVANNGLHTVENVAVLGVLRQLIVDELGFNSFLRGYNEHGLGSTGGETTQKVVCLALLG